MNRVFISHGHNEVAKHKLKAFVKERLAMEPVILAEQPDLGLTVVEKLEKYARECHFALILLTADDQTVNGGARARQNVTHELGFFHGVLGRDRVLLLKQSGVELFSNISGLIYKEFERDAIESVFEDIRMALESSSAQRGGLTVPKEEPDDIKALLGSWSVTHSRDETYVAIWTFLPDKTAFVKTARYTTKGEWRLEEKCVRIIWESRQRNRPERCWDTLFRPINPAGVRGNSWDGPNLWRAAKILSPG